MNHANQPCDKKYLHQISHKLIDPPLLTKDSGVVHGIKWYPAGATTNSQHGVKKITLCDPVLAAMEEHDVPLLVHAERNAHQSVSVPS